MISALFVHENFILQVMNVQSLGMRLCPSCHENFSLVKIFVQGTKLSRTKILVTVQVGGPGIIYHVGDLEGREKVDTHDRIT